jgi:hypothetical protein
MHMLDDLTFAKAHEGDSMEAYRQRVSNDFNEFKRYNEKCKQFVIEQRRETIIKDPKASQIPAQQYLFPNKMASGGQQHGNASRR